MEVEDLTDIYERFLIYIINKNLISERKIFKLRLICSHWKETIEKYCSDIDTIKLSQISIRKALSYDETIYDQYYYKRQLIKNNLCDNFNEYKNLTIPIIQSCVMDINDLDEIENIPDVLYFVGEKSMPDEYLIFIHEYLKSPSVFAKLYDISYIKNVLHEQNILLQKFMSISVSNRGVPNCILLIPILYSKHVHINIKDRQYVSVLCYINIIDETLEAEFSSQSEKYIVLTIDIDNSLDLERIDDIEHYNKTLNYIISIINSIMGCGNKLSDFCYPSDIATISQSFEKCLITLLTNHNAFDI